MSYSIQEWRKRGEELAAAHNTHQWEIADWLLAGTELPAMSATAYDAAHTLFPQYSHQTFKEWVRVARAYPAYARAYANLTFSHYRAALVNVADEAKCAEWLRQANEWQPRWSVAELTRRILAAQMPPAPVLATEPEPEPVSPEPPKPTPTITSDEEYRVLRRVMPRGDQLAVHSLASARNTTAIHIVAEAVGEYIAAHAEELEAARALDEAKGKANRKAMREVERQSARNAFVGHAGASEWEAMHKEALIRDEQAKWGKSKEEYKAKKEAEAQAKRLTVAQDKAMVRMFPEYCAQRHAAAKAAAQAQAQATEAARIAAIEAEKTEWRNNTPKLQAVYVEALVEYAHKEAEAVRVAQAGAEQSTEWWREPAAVGA